MSMFTEGKAKIERDEHGRVVKIESTASDAGVLVAVLVDDIRASLEEFHASNQRHSHRMKRLTWAMSVLIVLLAGLNLVFAWSLFLFARIG